MSTNDDDDDNQSGDAEDNEVKNSMVGGKALFNRQKKGGTAKLEDFKILKMIGKGTFGKVFLVEHQQTGKLYAMKCIRKDIIIENEQMENI